MDDKVFYKLLDVSKHCTDEKLKKAYYRAAKKYHPDCCQGTEAERMFADISLTYKRIVEQRKKRFSLKNIFNAEPVDNEVTKAGSVPEPGVDIHTSINLNLKESIVGCNKRIHIIRLTRCSCGSEQSEPDANCPSCYGLGTYKKEVDIDIKIPNNVKDGQTLKLTGKGNAGDIGAVNGDLIIHVSILPDKTFFLKDNDIYIKKTLTYPEAVMGMRVTVPTVYGDEEIEIPAGIKHREKIRIPEKGIKNGSSIGDEFVVIYIDIPKLNTANSEIISLLAGLQKKLYNRELPNHDKCKIS